MRTTDFGLDDLGDPATAASSETEVHVTVRDVNEPPRLRAAEAYWVPEDAAESDLVGFVFVSDPDAGQSHAFSLAPLGGSAAAGDFVVARTVQGGVERGALLVGSAGALDFEAQPVVQLAVTVSDGALGDTRTVTVMVNNSNDAPACPETLSLRMPENAVGPLGPADGARGWARGRGAFNFSDDDDPAVAPAAWGTLAVSVEAGGTASVAVACNRPGCATREANLTLLSALDYEESPVATFVVTATDGGGLACSSYATIHVEDVNEGPTFAAGQRNRTFFVGVNSLAGGSVGFVEATDADDGSTAFGALNYSLFATGADCGAVAVDGLSPPTVRVDPTSGEVLVQNTAGLVQDRVFCLGVRVADGGGLVAETSAVFAVANINTEPTMFDAKVKVPPGRWPRSEREDARLRSSFIDAHCAPSPPLCRTCLLALACKRWPRTAAPSRT